MHKNETAHVTDCHLIGFNKTRSANCDRTDRMVPKLAIVVATGSNVLKMVVVMTQKYIFASYGSEKNPDEIFILLWKSG